MLLEVGKPLPKFELKNQDNQTRSNKDYAGNWMVLYIYPKDDTPGCTIQGKSFTETKKQYDDLGVKVVGLSQDDVESHKNFCKKYSFTIELLSDVSAGLLKGLGVGQTEYKGTMYWDRTTFLVDPKGIVRKVYPKVSPEGHEKTLLNDIQEMKKHSH
ncbi:MAG: peroxiredoxin [Bdellovibrionales bacterium]|nr:peroxiredoxin [Bdellovibrionales bacterium]